jgi:hypothetical protein
MGQPSQEARPTEAKEVPPMGQQRSPGSYLGNRLPEVAVSSDYVVPATRTSPGLRLSDPVRTMRPGEMKRGGRYVSRTTLPISNFEVD